MSETEPTPNSASDENQGITRRLLVAGAAGIAGAVALASGASAQAPEGFTVESATDEPWKRQGVNSSPYGFRSPFEADVVRTGRIGSSSSLTPLDRLHGIITPAPLHFERHHAGIPNIDPSRHQLLIHGLVRRPMVFTMNDLRRLPSISRIYSLECSGNGGNGYVGTRQLGSVNPDQTAQSIDGLTSCSEWTGVPLRTVLNLVGVQPGATWLLAEGADAALMTRSIPIEKAMDDVLLAYGQNGEALQPAQGYPVRLLVPGWEGNINVKWLRRLKLGTEPFQTREETSKYTDPIGETGTGDTARQFTFVNEAKSIITYPSGANPLNGAGWYEVKGIAWSGYGRIATVEISTDGGGSWVAAELQEPVLPMAHTRFRLMWYWDGGETVLSSRATDETGYTQPTQEAYRNVRGPQTSYHYNQIRTWKIGTNGRSELIYV